MVTQIWDVGGYGDGDVDVDDDDGGAGDGDGETHRRYFGEKEQTQLDLRPRARSPTVGESLIIKGEGMWLEPPAGARGGFLRQFRRKPRSGWATLVHSTLLGR